MDLIEYTLLIIIKVSRKGKKKKNQHPAGIELKTSRVSAPEACATTAAHRSVTFDAKKSSLKPGVEPGSLR